jgi:hypothetical protein
VKVGNVAEVSPGTGIAKFKPLVPAALTGTSGFIVSKADTDTSTMLVLRMVEGLSTSKPSYVKD